MAELRFQQNSLSGSKSNVNSLTVSVLWAKRRGGRCACGVRRPEVPGLSGWGGALLARETAGAEPGAAAAAGGAGRDESSAPGHSVKRTRPQSGDSPFQLGPWAPVPSFRPQSSHL